MSKLIGITGGIGSGKSSVAKLIEAAGYPIYYSDTRAKEIVNTDLALKKALIALLGEETYDSAGVYNRKYVAAKVFSNEELLQALNHLIHPAVKRDFEDWKKSQSSDLIFKETALLFELNLQKDCFKSILVTADQRIRIKRVMDRDQKTYREVEAVVKKQMPERAKIRYADFIIYNNSSFEELENQTKVVLNKLRDLGKENTSTI